MLKVKKGLPYSRELDAIAQQYADSVSLADTNTSKPASEGITLDIEVVVGVLLLLVCRYHSGTM